MKTFNARIASVTRLDNSTAGNPRWSVTLNNGQTYTTAKDSTAGYVVFHGIHKYPVALTVSGNTITSLMVNK
jgi:hypothetical protein